MYNSPDPMISVRPVWVDYVARTNHGRNYFINRNNAYIVLEYTAQFLIDNFMNNIKRKIKAYKQGYCIGIERVIIFDPVSGNVELNNKYVLIRYFI